MVQGTMSSVAEITKNMKRFNKYVNTINIAASCLIFKYVFLRLKSNMLLNTRMKYCPMSKF